MRFTKRTFYMLGIVAAALNAVGSVMLIFSTYWGLAFDVASIASAAMMLFLVPKLTDNWQKYTSLAGALLMVFGMMGGVPGKFCGALGWPVFAVGYWRGAQPESIRRTSAGLVLAAGAVQLIGSFITLPNMVRIVMALAIAVVQGVLAWTLYREEPPAAPEA